MQEETQEMRMSVQLSTFLVYAVPTESIPK